MIQPARTIIRQRLYAFLIAGLGGLIASGVSFGMTVYKAAHPPKVPVVTAGQRIDTGRWFVTLRSAHSGTVPPTGIAPLTPKQFLMVDLDATNRAATPSNLIARAVKLDVPGQKLPDPTVYLDRDRYFAGFLNPGMPERVTIAWEWPAGTPLPQKVDLTVNRQIYKLRDNLYGASGWYDHGAAATVDLAVTKAP